MDHSDFHIGIEFMCSDRRWRCTDVGSRVVVAIRIDTAQQSWADKSTGEGGVRILSRLEADGIGWFDGPPYIVAETVFDEYDLEGCEALPDL